MKAIDELKKKKYEFKTLEEIVDTLEMTQIENFIIDFKSFLEYGIAIRKITKNNKTGLQRFTWIDDGKHEEIYNVTEKTTGYKVTIKLT